ncbi:hypothetical protein U1Q18_022140 [Sarracenia purpurea var. burkii]
MVPSFFAGTCVSTLNPKSLVDLSSRTSVQPRNQKGTEKNRAPFVPFVICFSEDDSGSDSEEFRQSKAPEAKGNSLTVGGNRRAPASSLPKSQIPHWAKKNDATSMPRKASLSRSFVSSMAKINGANSRNSGYSLVEQGSHVRNSNTLHKKLTGMDHGGDQNMHFNSSKLQDLRQQIANREKELKLKSAQQNKETGLDSSRNYNITDSDNDSVRKRRVSSAGFVPFDQIDLDKKKRPKISEPHRSRLISDIWKQTSLVGPVHSVVISEKPVLQNGGQLSITDLSHRDKETPLGTMHSGAVLEKKQDDTLGPLSVGKRSTGVKGGADDIVNGNQCDQNTMLDPSISSRQTEKIVNNPAKNFPKTSSTVELKYSSELNCHCTQMLEKATCGHNLAVGGELHEVGSGEKACNPISNDKHLACSLHVPASDLKTSDVSLNNSSPCSCLGRVSISQDNNMDMHSLRDIEELHDKDLEEAQEHRRNCEIEERKTLIAYRNAQRALMEANARCSYLYQKREFCSAHFRSLMMENPSLFWSSRLQNCTGARLNSSSNMSEDHVHQLPTSIRGIQAEFNDCNQHGHRSNIQTANGALQIMPCQHAEGQDLASDPCSEPDASTSELHKDDRMEDGVFSPSNDLNESADEDEETFPFDHQSGHTDLDSQRKEESYGQREQDMNDEAKRKFSFDSCQDSLLLEATLRSQLFARLGTKTLPEKRGPAHSMEPAVVTGVERGGVAGEVEMSFRNVPLPAVEKSEHCAFGGSDGQEKITSEVPVLINEGYAENFGFNYVSPTTDPLDSCFSIEVKQPSISVTFSCPILRSTFGHLKVAERIRLVCLQSRNQLIHNYSICNEDGNNVGSTEIPPRVLSSNSMDETSMNICAGNVGCYSCNLAIDPFWPLCMFELRGKCNNDECSWQHAKDYSGTKMNLENSDIAVCQVGSSTNKGKSYGATNTSKGSDGLGLAAPTYLVCLDMLKADLHPNGSVLGQSFGQCWQKCFSSSLVLSSLLPSDSPTDEPFLHGTQARIEVHGNWNSQSLYFHCRNSAMLKRILADAILALTLLHTAAPQVYMFFGVLPSSPILNGLHSTLGPRTLDELTKDLHLRLRDGMVERFERRLARWNW